MRGHACCCDDCSHVTRARGVSTGLATLLRDGHTGMVNLKEHRMAGGTRVPMRVDGSPFHPYKKYSKADISGSRRMSHVYLHPQNTAVNCACVPAPQGARRPKLIPRPIGRQYSRNTLWVKRAGGCSEGRTLAKWKFQETTFTCLSQTGESVS